MICARVLHQHLQCPHMYLSEDVVECPGRKQQNQVTFTSPRYKIIVIQSQYHKLLLIVQPLQICSITTCNDSCTNIQYTCQLASFFCTSPQKKKCFLLSHFEGHGDAFG